MKVPSQLGQDLQPELHTAYDGVHVRATGMHVQNLDLDQSQVTRKQEPGADQIVGRVEGGTSSQHSKLHLFVVCSFMLE